MAIAVILVSGTERLLFVDLAVLLALTGDILDSIATVVPNPNCPPGCC